MNLIWITNKDLNERKCGTLLNALPKHVII